MTKNKGKGLQKLLKLTVSCISHNSNRKHSKFKGDLLQSKIVLLLWLLMQQSYCLGMVTDIIDSGNSMLWFGKPRLFATIYGPAALAGLLLPFAMLCRMPSLSASLLGFGLVQAVIAASLTAAKGRSGFMSAGWAVTSIAGAVALSCRVSQQMLCFVMLCESATTLLCHAG